MTLFRLFNFVCVHSITNYKKLCGDVAAELLKKNVSAASSALQQLLALFQFIIQINKSKTILEMVMKLWKAKASRDRAEVMNGCRAHIIVAAVKCAACETIS